MSLSKTILNKIKKDYHFEEFRASKGDIFTFFAREDHAVYALICEIERLEKDLSDWQKTARREHRKREKDASNDRARRGKTGGRKGSADSE